LPEVRDRLLKARIRPSKKSLIQAARNRAIEIKRRLEATPGLSQSAVAKELKVSRARVTQILRRLKAKG
jgi:DNA-binding MarR family transcriptional regulator